MLLMAVKSLTVTALTKFSEVWHFFALFSDHSRTKHFQGNYMQITFQENAYKLCDIGDIILLF